ncbi:MAG: hypothetical protein J5910_04180 [Lachnospiraceae bacterium]|nr:hypothetical protein [Lachnospiraceae bacterium]
MEMISVDYRSLKDKTKHMAKLCTQLADEICAISRYVQELDIFWDGDVSDGYMIRISKDLVEMGKILHGISDLAKTMRPVLDVYMENEKEVKRRLEI